jgi:(2Fe-2S) ferredoxin
MLRGTPFLQKSGSPRPSPKNFNICVRLPRVAAQEGSQPGEPFPQKGKTMQKPDHHIFVCASFRGTEAKGKCIKKDSLQLIPYLQEELADRGINAMVSSTGCLNLCEEGPVMVIYPQGTWYRGVDSEEALDEILDALENGKPVEKYLLS